MDVLGMVNQCVISSQIILIKGGIFDGGDSASPTQEHQLCPQIFYQINSIVL